MSDLDDFFAKKDKKKSKAGKAKGFSKANTDVLAKTLEENDRREQLRAGEDRGAPLATSLALEEKLGQTEAARPGEGQGQQGGQRAEEVPAATRSATSSSNPEDSASNTNVTSTSTGTASSKYFGIISQMNDDEWHNYANEKKDYSGLKIESLKVTDADKSDDGEHMTGDDGERRGRRKKANGGPWNRNTVQSQKEDDDDSSDADEDNGSKKSSEASPKVERSIDSNAAAPSTKGSYVPPHLRNVSSQSSGPTLAPVRLGGAGRRSRQAPDINSEIYFPSLSGASVAAQAEAARTRGQGDFEEVRFGGQQVSSHSTEAPKLELGNKFDALRD